jgi:hypothetical protein
LSKAKDTAKVKSSIDQAISSKAIGKITSKTEVALSFSTMATSSKANGPTTSPKAAVASTIKPVTTSLDNTKTATEKVSGLIFLRQDKKSKASGKATMTVLGNSFIPMAKSMKDSC